MDRITPDSHPKWLDVSSYLGATAFPGFEFTSVEPDSWVVAYGPKLFHPDPGAAIAKAASLLRTGGMLVLRIGGYFARHMITPVMLICIAWKT